MPRYGIDSAAFSKYPLKSDEEAQRQAHNLVAFTLVTQDMTTVEFFSVSHFQPRWIVTVGTVTMLHVSTQFTLSRMQQRRCLSVRSSSTDDSAQAFHLANRFKSC